MLSFDLAGISGRELEEAIVSRCSQFGTVAGVKIVPPAKHRDYAIAVVTMANPVEADKVVVKVGDMKCGASAIIRLSQEEQQIPSSLKRPADSIAAAATQVRRRSPARGRNRNSSADSAPQRRTEVEILLVEDNPADVRMTREALNAAGVPHRLHVVEDGMDAISFLFRTRQFNDVPRPDVVLLDLNIPRVNGHEVLAEIKTSEILRHIPVVVLTCSKAQNDIDKSYDCNADYFMTKPAGLDAFAVEMKKVGALAAH